MISEKDVLHIASLSRIHLKEEEVDRLRTDLENILHYVQKLEKLDTAAIDPMSHVLPIKNVTREDAIVPSLTQEEALKIAVERLNSSFKVPKVIE